MNGADARPVVGLFGAFDTGELGEVALRRVVESELSRRRPDIDVVALAPFGAERPVPGDEGRPARPLPLGSGSDSLGLDALVIAGDVLGHDDAWAARYPVPVKSVADRGVGVLALSGTRGGRDAAPLILWFGVGPAGGDAEVSDLAGKNAWARDLATQERLGGTAVQSGDPVLLVSRLFAPEVLRKRADLLRLCGAAPAGRRLVLEAASDLAAPVRKRLVDAIGVALRLDPKLSVVVVNLNPTRDSTLDVAGLAAERVHHLPAWAGLDDIAAGISGSVAVVATSPAGAHLAAALGVPVAAIDSGLRDRFDPAIPVIEGDTAEAIRALLAGARPLAIDAAVQTLDGAFAELAERLPPTAGKKRTAIHPDEVGSALALLQQRLVDERAALQAELSRLQSGLDHLRASPEHRITRPIREWYQRWQRRRT